MTATSDPQATAVPGDGANDFETLFRRLEAVTQALEDGNLTLDKSVALYEEGVRLARACEQLLLDAEQRIDVLDAADDGGGFPDDPPEDDA